MKKVFSWQMGTLWMLMGCGSVWGISLLLSRLAPSFSQAHWVVEHADIPTLFWGLIAFVLWSSSSPQSDWIGSKGIWLLLAGIVFFAYWYFSIL